MPINQSELALFNELKRFNKVMSCNIDNSYNTLKLKIVGHKTRLNEIKKKVDDSGFTVEFRDFFNAFYQYCLETLKSFDQSTNMYNYYNYTMFNYYLSKFRNIYLFFITENKDNYDLAKKAGLNPNFQEIKFILPHFLGRDDYAMRTYADFPPQLQQEFHTDFLDHYKTFVREKGLPPFVVCLFTCALIVLELFAYYAAGEFNILLSLQILSIFILTLCFLKGLTLLNQKPFIDIIKQIENSSSMQDPLQVKSPAKDVEETVPADLTFGQ